MREIQLTQGKIALVDDDDFEELNRFKWQVAKNYQTYYAVRSLTPPGGKQTTIYMHKSVIGKLDSLKTDHIDGNGLNNQKNNLRLVTSRQNCQNFKNMDKTSKYPGVCWYKSLNKWRAKIQIDGATKHLGYFTSEENAFDAYRKAVNAIGEEVIDFSK